ncbi:membrane protein [candidate division LCP-89 bacterium B3_LCP]|uniref:Membrane protein n=1 Tax=candidate division LCP-89 bacterium B3_LCP TaxID=2012998 RepID=A0A532UTW4_UNCL8|nr:MAG: membrane protein [candidate division LCP-89 bacterium B3_LCP]
MSLKYANRTIAAIIFVLTLIIYLATVADTLSFWDCGEFIASSVIMGVPHPPGSPFYLLLGKMFTMIPFGDIGWRVNLISVLVSALSVMLLYLTIVRLIRHYRGIVETGYDALITYGSAAIGAFAYGFSHSQWFNAVEAEVYSISLFFTALVFYLIVRWADEADDPVSDRLLLIIAYVIGLAIGVHLLNILALPAIALVIYFRKRKFSLYTFSIAIAATIAGFVVIYPGVVKWLPGTFSIGAIIPLIIFVAVILACYYALKNRQRVLSLALISTFLIILGYSTYGVIFIRSNLDPPIDENNPDTIERFLSYLNREQYGDTGILPRRWNNDPNYKSETDFFWRYQVGHMYNRYFLWQYVGQEGDFQGASVDFSKFFALPLLLGLWGLVHHASKDRRRALIVFTLFFMTGYAVIAYLNQDNPQPRERDYAYVGSFYAFAVWIGIGAQGLLDSVIKWLKKQNKVSFTAALLGVVFLAVPFNMFAKNYRMHNRSGNYVAYDYSRNILETCEQDALIFTNGDNDTFPLWYLQEVVGLRKDIRIVNLSLLNTGWYIKQLKHDEPKVPISFSDDFIDRYLDQHDLTALRLRYWPKNDPQKPTKISLQTPDSGTIEWDVPATMHLPTGAGDTGENNFLRVQDMMIIDIIRENNWKRPIYFAVTVSNSNMIGLNDHLTMEGLAFQVNPEKGQRIDPDRLLENLLTVYKEYYRNLDNPDIHYDENVHRLLQNYRSAYLQLATHYLVKDRPGTAVYDPDRPPDETLRDFDQLSDRDKVLFLVDSMERYLPDEVVPISSHEIVLHIGQLYADLGRPEELTKRLERLSKRQNASAENLFRYGAVYLQWTKDTLSAKTMFERALDKDSSPEMKLQVATAYRQLGLDEEAQFLMQEVSTGQLDEDLSMKVGMTYLQLGQLDKAREIYEELAVKSPNSGSVVGGLLMVYERQEDFLSAEELLTDWLLRHPNDTEAKERLEHYQQLTQGDDQ